MNEQILTILTWRVRCASQRQLAAGLGLCTDEIRRRIRWLRREHLVETQILTVATDDRSEPLACWDVGWVTPEFSRLAWLLEKRWAESPRTAERVVWTARTATRLVGGVGGRLRQPLQVQHDLGTTHMFFAWLHRNTTAKTHWLNEDVYRTHGLRDWKIGKVPDAAVVDSENRVVRVFEYGGQYSWKRLRAFHRYWAARRISYEIW